MIRFHHHRPTRVSHHSNNQNPIVAIQKLPRMNHQHISNKFMPMKKYSFKIYEIILSNIHDHYDVFSITKKLFNYFKILKRYCVLVKKWFSNFNYLLQICTISESVIRQCERLIVIDPTNSSISAIYQSFVRILNLISINLFVFFRLQFGVMHDSYRTYISGSLIGQSTLKQCEDKIAYFLQVCRLDRTE